MKTKLLSLALTFMIGLAALPAKAQGLVPCGTTGNPEECSLCYLLELVKNIIDFLVIIAAPIAVVFIVWGGFMLLIAGGSEEKISQGKKILSSAVTGLVIVLISWLLIATIIGVGAIIKGFGRDSIDFGLTERGFTIDCE